MARFKNKNTIYKKITNNSFCFVVPITQFVMSSVRQLSHIKTNRDAIVIVNTYLERQLHNSVIDTFSFEREMAIKKHGRS